MTSTSYRHSQPGMLLETVSGDLEVFLELNAIFTREGASKFEQLCLAAAAGDLEQLGYQSHSLRGTVGPLGADALLQMLLDLENECERKQCICDQKRLSVIEEELNQVRREMQQYGQAPQLLL